MVEFALLATVLVAVVIAVVWKVRPRDAGDDAESVSVNPPPGMVAVTSKLESPLSILEMAKRERNGDFRASLAGLVSPERWQSSRSSSLDELRRIVETWADSTPEVGEATANSPDRSTDFYEQAEVGPDPSGDLVSSVARAVGVPLVEVRIRNRSEVIILMRQDRTGIAPTAVIR